MVFFRHDSPRNGMSFGCPCVSPSTFQCEWAAIPEDTKSGAERKNLGRDGNGAGRREDGGRHDMSARRALTFLPPPVAGDPGRENDSHHTHDGGVRFRRGQDARRIDRRVERHLVAGPVLKPAEAGDERLQALPVPAAPIAP